MRYCDYHLHTNYSFDSREEMENVCRKAIDSGMKEICFTEHVEFGADDTDGFPDFSLRDAELERLNAKYYDVSGSSCTFLRGVESGQAIKDREGERRLFSENSFDFVIASLHLVGDYGRPSKIDFSIENNYLRFYEDYFRKLKELAESCEYDVVGHLTFPFRYAPVEMLLKHPIEGYEKDFRELFEIIIGRDKGIEVNTSGLRMPSLTDTLPGLTILKWYRECGGRIVTVGSDGHSVRSAFSGIEKGYDALRLAGFSEVMLYRDRRPEPYAII